MKRQRGSAREKRQKDRPLVRVPAQDGMTPFESLAAAGDLVSPSEEFGGRPSPNFLEEELAAGQRELAKRRAEANEKKRLADQMREDLK